MAIINFLEEICERGSYGFPSNRSLLKGSDALERAWMNEMTTLAEELTIAWNPVRSFGTDAGPFHNAAAAKEMLRWVRRTMLALETYMQESNRHLVNLADNHVQVTLADIVLYQFPEFTSDCYGVDVTDGSGAKVVDVYGREVADTYPNIRRFFEAFRLRGSAKRIEEAGEVPNIKAKAAMGAWVDGVL